MFTADAGQCCLKLLLKHFVHRYKCYFCVKMWMPKIIKTLCNSPIFWHVLVLIAGSFSTRFLKSMCKWQHFYLSKKHESHDRSFRVVHLRIGYIVVWLHSRSHVNVSQPIFPKTLGFHERNYEALPSSMVRFSKINSCGVFWDKGLLKGKRLRGTTLYYRIWGIECRCIFPTKLNLEVSVALDWWK